MKTLNLTIFLVSILGLTLFSSCNKDNETKPAGQNPNGGSPTYPSPTVLHGTDYVDFKLDGNQISMNNFSYTPPKLPIGTASFASTPAIPLYQFIGMFMNAGENFTASLLQLKDSVPFTLGVYSNNGMVNFNKYFSFSLITSDKKYYLPEEQSYNTIEFTRIDTIDGGKVEGTFSLTKLFLTNEDEVIFSTNHSITEGKFSLTVNK
jgi:hypothetical protein